MLYVGFSERMANQANFSRKSGLVKEKQFPTYITSYLVTINSSTDFSSLSTSPGKIHIQLSHGSRIAYAAPEKSEGPPSKKEYKEGSG